MQFLVLFLSIWVSIRTISYGIYEIKQKNKLRWYYCYRSFNYSLYFFKHYDKSKGCILKGIFLYY